MLHCRDENPHRHPRCRAHLPTGPPLLFAYGIHIKEGRLCGLTFFEVSLVIFKVVAQGYSFHQVLAALEIWTSSLYGKHSLDLTEKLWLVGVLPQDQCLRDSTVAMHISEVCLEISEVIAWGHSFHRTKPVLKIWRSSLVGNPALELTPKWQMIGIRPQDQCLRE